jgi:hypothetical protein
MKIRGIGFFYKFQEGINVDSIHFPNTLRDRRI